MKIHSTAPGVCLLLQSANAYHTVCISILAKKGNTFPLSFQRMKYFCWIHGVTPTFKQ